MNAFCLPILRHSTLWGPVLCEQDRESVIFGLPKVVEFVRNGGQVTDQQLLDIYPTVKHMKVHHYDRNRDSWKFISRKRSTLLLHSDFLASLEQTRLEAVHNRLDKVADAERKRALKALEEEERIAKRAQDAAKKIKDAAAKDAKKKNDAEQKNARDTALEEKKIASLNVKMAKVAQKNVEREEKAAQKLANDGKKRKAAEEKQEAYLEQVRHCQEVEGCYMCFMCSGGLSSSDSSERAQRLIDLLPKNKSMIGTWVSCDFASEGAKGCDRFVCDRQHCITWLEEHENICKFNAKNNVTNKKQKAGRD